MWSLHTYSKSIRQNTHLLTPSVIFKKKEININVARYMYEFDNLGFERDD